MSTCEGGRRIKIEVRGIPETRQMLMYISERMKRVGDLATKLKFVCKDIKETDEIKIYREEFLLPDNENINIIETEYVEEKEDKDTLVKVKIEVSKEQENKLEKKELELNIKEISLKNWEDNLRKKEEDLKMKEENLDKIEIEGLDDKKNVKKGLKIVEENVLNDFDAGSGDDLELSIVNSNAKDEDKNLPTKKPVEKKRKGKKESMTLVDWYIGLERVLLGERGLSSKRLKSN